MTLVLGAVTSWAGTHRNDLEYKARSLIAALPFTPNHATWTPPDAAAALAELEGLAVKPAGTIHGYSRARLFPTWGDLDGDGCNTRTEVLERDLTDPTVVDRKTKAGTIQCQVIFGTLRDPYTGRTIAYTIKAPSEVQIDHMVPLGEAWKSGASGWTAAQWMKYGNDERNLLAVSGSANESKGDRDPARWLPPDKADWCAYAERYVGVKDAYGLAVDALERTRLTTILKGC
jgi:hypothetical protein